MKTALRKTLSMLLALCVWTAFVPLSVLAAEGDVCEIVGGDRYTSLGDALAEVSDGGTIKLLDDIVYGSGIVVVNRSITFDLNGKTLNVVNDCAVPDAMDEGSGLFVQGNATVTLMGTGEFNVTGTWYGVFAACDEGETVSVTVTNATGSVRDGVAAQGATVIVKGDARSTGAEGSGVWADYGAHVTVEGNVTASGEESIGVRIYDDAVVTVKGNVTAVGTDSLGIYAEDSNVTVIGNVAGEQGGVEATASTIDVTGDVQSGGTGVMLDGDPSEDGPSQVTIDGVITAPVYIQIGSGTLDYDDYVLDSGIIEGYRIYTNDSGKGTVYVMDVLPPQFAGGDGTLDTPYLVATADQINNVRNHLDKHFLQTADIDLDVAPYNSGAGWEPIGTSVNPFTGTFDGDGYTVSNLFVNRNAADHVGLFGYTGTEAQIHNLGLVDVGVKGHNYVGGLVGYSMGSITRCYATGTATGYMRVGGLAGLSEGSITESYAIGTVTGTETDISYTYVGGLVGSNIGPIRDSYARADVSGEEDVAGLAGYNMGSITNAYSTGAVRADSYVGGLVGYNWLPDGSVVSSYWDKETSLQTSSDGGEGKTTAEMKQQATYVGWDFEDRGIWGINDSDNDGYPFLRWHDYEEAPSEFDGGDGTEADPFLIATPVQLNNVRNYLGTEHASKHFKLTANLDLNVVPYNSGAGWEPIGDDDNPFTGTFDGDEHSISNLLISRGDTNHVGLFGCTGAQAEIHDLGLLNVAVTGEDYVGGLVGWNDGLVTGSYSTGTVSGDDGVGGLVGANYGKISRCFASVAAEGTRYGIGGLVGKNAATMDGGDVVSLGEIEDCYATGTVHGISQVGGLVGSGSGGSLTRTYSTGKVTGTSSVGGLLGEGGGNKSYWDMETSGRTTSAGGSGVVGKTTAEMKQQATYEGWNFDEIWGVHADQNSGYPFLIAVTPAGPETPDAGAVALDKAALTWDTIKGGNERQDSVTGNLVLPTSGTNGTTIGWSVLPDGGFINTTSGAVTRPTFTDGDRTVTLTATIRKGEASDTVVFTLTIIALPAPPPSGGSIPVHLITVKAGPGGTITPKTITVLMGIHATFSVIPDAGYEILDVLVDGESVGPVTTYTFGEVTRQHSIAATFGRIFPFQDVLETDWFFNSVQFAFENDLMTGTAADQFCPQLATNRAMIATILHRLENTPDASVVAFTDVMDGTWYADAVAWAAANGIAEGFGDGRFGPEAPVTREQIACFFYRYSQYAGRDVSGLASLTDFVDGDKTSEWAKEAMQWAVGCGLIIGKDGDVLDPTGPATRAEVATMLRRFIGDN